MYVQRSNYSNIFYSVIKSVIYKKCNDWFLPAIKASQMNTM